MIFLAERERALARSGPRAQMDAQSVPPPSVRPRFPGTRFVAVLRRLGKYMRGLTSATIWSEEKRIVSFFFVDGCERAMARTEEGIGREAENLFADFRLCQVPGLVAATN